MQTRAACQSRRHGACGLARRLWKVDCRGNREVGQGDPGRQYQAGVIVGPIFHNVPICESRWSTRRPNDRCWHFSAVPTAPSNVGFSNRPFRVKRFQTIHDCGVNVARGLALLSGLGTKALPSWVSKTRWNNLSGDLAVNVTAGSSGRTNSPHPSSREGHHSTARWSSSVLLLD